MYIRSYFKDHNNLDSAVCSCPIYRIDASQLGSPECEMLTTVFPRNRRLELLEYVYTYTVFCNVHIYIYIDAEHHLRCAIHVFHYMERMSTYFAGLAKSHLVMQA